MSFAQIVQEIKVKLPEVCKGWEAPEPSKHGAFDMNWSSEPIHATFAETQDFVVIAVMIGGSYWCDREGGVEWNKHLKVYFAKKTEGTFFSVDTEKVIIRDQSDSKKDKKDLWKYDYVAVKAISTSKNEIQVFWTDKEQSQGPQYTYELDILYVKNKESKKCTK